MTEVKKKLGRPRIHPPKPKTKKRNYRGRDFWSANEAWFVRIYQGSTKPEEASLCVGMCKQSKIEARMAELEAAGIPYYAERYWGSLSGYVTLKVYEGRA